MILMVKLRMVKGMISISLNGDGTIVAIGAPYNNGTAVNAACKSISVCE